MSFNLTKDEYEQEQFKGLDLSGETFNGITFEECLFAKCHFNETTFRGCSFEDCRFIECDMSVAKFGNSKFESVQFEGCRLSGIDWTLAAYSDYLYASPYTFENCIMDYGSFFGLRLHDLVMRECKVSEVDFREADLLNASFVRSDLSHTVFRNTKLVKADFSGAEHYTIDLTANQLKGAKFSRDEAVHLLEPLEIELVD
ncbi:MAG: pentapeptide repeat-containing protein [Helicobacteraceae bacterium]|jgi:fluoroquinolone resistance protein|nr:pentapeptide repeat-containing protein [Helicobacteraceae bacterium]